MPFAETGPVKLYYESRGRGPVVLLVIGLGMTLGGWRRTAPVLARSFRVLSFDNRGIGRSDGSALPYSVAAMADDAIAVLDAAGEQRAHVYGISLGGMVAQELALLGPGGYLVNTSRGPIVDEAALIAALRGGVIAGAGLDVFAVEPLPASHPLRSLPNTVITPHIGYVTSQGYLVFYRDVVENIGAWLDGSPVRIIS